MNADSFVAALERCAPTIDSLVLRGIPRERAIVYRGAWLCRRNANVTPQEDPLLDLVNRYDMSMLEIGMIRLHSEHLRAPADSCGRPEKHIVGILEADPLAIDIKSGRVEVLGHDNPHYVMGVLAADTSRFLDALAALAGYSLPHKRVRGVKLTRSQTEENRHSTEEAASECARLAGLSAGEGEIWKLLYGVDRWQNEKG